MIPTLSHIEKAIRANFVLSKHPSRFLETDPEKERDTRTAARMVFVGIALANGWRQQEICDYLSMTVQEYNGKLREFKEHLEKGGRKDQLRRMMERTKYEQKESFDLDLRIYRKNLLITNYINNLKWTYKVQFCR